MVELYEYLNTNKEPEHKELTLETNKKDLTDVATMKHLLSECNTNPIMNRRALGTMDIMILRRNFFKRTKFRNLASKIKEEVRSTKGEGLLADKLNQNFKKKTEKFIKLLEIF